MINYVVVVFCNLLVGISILDNLGMLGNQAKPKTSMAMVYCIQREVYIKVSLKMGTLMDLE